MEGRKIILAVILLTCLSLVLQCCEARAHGFESPARRRLLAEPDLDSSSGSYPSSFSLAMLHRDHEHSPLRDPATQNLTFVQRLKEAAKRSTLRAEFLRQTIQSLAAERSRNNGSRTSSRTQLLAVQSPVFSQQGEYIVNFNLGTPARKFVGILDSASDLAWVQCKPCEDCISSVPDALFDPSLSSSYANVPCDDDFCNSLPSTKTSPTCSGSESTCPFDYLYGDGTTSNGELATETLTFPGTSGTATSTPVPNFAFGCGGAHISGDLAGSDGVIGIGRGKLSLPSQLSATTGSNIFSFCLVSTYLASTATSPLLLGSNAFASAGNSSWTPIVSKGHSDFYYVQIKAIKVNGEALDIPASAFNIDANGEGGTIVDTGTTITELVPDAYDVLIDSLTHAVKYPKLSGSGDDYGFDLCWDITAGAVTNSIGGSTSPGFGPNKLPPGLPSISFQFKWSEFTIPPENAFLWVDSGVVCLTFDSGYGLNIIGNMHLQNFQVFVNNDRGVLGWKSAKCDQL